MVAAAGCWLVMRDAAIRGIVAVVIDFVAAEEEEKAHCSAAVFAEKGHCKQ